MALEIDIKKGFENFRLNVKLLTEAKRIGILGASGAGKSMLLKCIAGIESSDEGSIVIDDRILFDKELKKETLPRDRRVGYMFQSYALFPNMTVEKNIAAGVKRKGEEKKEIIGEMIEKFHLKGLEKRYPDQLSGGQQQRTALARIMASEPDVILLDEPFSASDTYLRKNLYDELEYMLKDFSGYIIMVSHDKDEIYRFAEETVILSKGMNVVSGKTKEVFENPATVDAAKLIGYENFCDISVINDGECVCDDWGISLNTIRNVPKDMNCIGYDSRDFIPSWDDKGIRTELIDAYDYPMERIYRLKVKEKDKMITWIVPVKDNERMMEKGFPKSLMIDESKILFLRREEKLSETCNEDLSV